MASTRFGRGATWTKATQAIQQHSAPGRPPASERISSNPSLTQHPHAAAARARGSPGPCSERPRGATTTGDLHARIINTASGCGEQRNKRSLIGVTDINIHMVLAMTRAMNRCSGWVPNPCLDGIQWIHTWARGAFSQAARTPGTHISRWSAEQVALAMDGFPNLILLPAEFLVKVKDGGKGHPDRYGRAASQMVYSRFRGSPLSRLFQNE